MSRTSSASWKATPSRSPYWVRMSTTDSSAPDIIAPNRQATAISEPVLPRDHVQVVLDRVAAVARAGGLQDLAGDQPLERLRLDADGLRARGRPVCARRGRRGSRRSARPPSCPSGCWRCRTPRRTSASSITSSWYSVARCVSSTTTADGHDTRRVRVTELRGEHHQQRPETLAARPHEMLRGLRDERDVALGGLEQPLLDSRQPGLDIGLKSLVPHAQPEGPDDGHEGFSCLLTITRNVDVSLPSLKSAYPVAFRSPWAPSRHRRYVRVAPRSDRPPPQPDGPGRLPATPMPLSGRSRASRPCPAAIPGGGAAVGTPRHGLRPREGSGAVRYMPAGVTWPGATTTPGPPRRSHAARPVVGGAVQATVGAAAAPRPCAPSPSVHRGTPCTSAPGSPTKRPTRTSGSRCRTAHSSTPGSGVRSPTNPYRRSSSTCRTG